MASEVTVEIAGRLGEAAIGQAIRDITLGYAQAVLGVMQEATPPPPARGSMKFVSEKQRRFVMAAINEGRIQVPYKRGTGGGLNGTETLRRSYRADLNGDEAVLTSAAQYAPYVVGDNQAAIHKGRWPTAMDAAEQVKGNGTLDSIVAQILGAL